ncbi:50S ribosomal protein L20 [Buchnera aphidicola]|uniref:Large ribosomal subunit protein bL20 n=1 Tax=Buchnera aphidicola (Cinara strobi) TaxID=1921549 RepID=A0A3B1E7Q3_9GAMM|nr:50S ribosomal protein L20 [Buchnera aphidicola]VAX76337.1 50S ribosomal protein L20 [Buchnera aphidicola (Cinara strobi)]
MARVKRGVTAHARHKKIIKLAKGYYGARSRVYRVAKQAVIKAGQYSYRDRRNKKRNFRKLWIIRINAAAKIYNLSYSQFMYGLKKSFININRKILAETAIFDKNAFSKLVDCSKRVLFNN